MRRASIARRRWPIAVITLSMAAACGGATTDGSSPAVGPGSTAAVTDGTTVLGWTLDRSAAVAYADLWSNANGPNGEDVTSDGQMANPAYVHFDDDDCANFVSQSWQAGGVPTTAQWWANATEASTDWQNVNDFVAYWLAQPGPAGAPAATLSDSILVSDDMPPGVAEGDAYAFHFNTQSEYWNHVGLDVYANASGTSAVETTYSDSSGFTVDYGGQPVRHLDQHTNDRYRAPWNYGWLRNIDDPTMTSDEAIQAKQGNWIVKAVRLTSASPASATAAPPGSTTPTGAATGGASAAAPPRATGVAFGQPRSRIASAVEDDVTGAAVASLAQNDRVLLLSVAATASPAERTQAVDARVQRLAEEVPAVWSRARASSKIEQLTEVLHRRRDYPDLYPVDDIRSDIAIVGVRIDDGHAHVLVRDTVRVHVPEHQRHVDAVVHQAVDDEGWSPPSLRRYELELVEEDGTWKLERVRDRSL